MVPDDSLLEAIPAGILVLEEDCVVYANDAALRVLRREREQIVGRSYRDWLPLEEQVRFSDRLRRYHRGELVPHEYELTVLGGDGTPLTLEFHVRLHAGRTLLHVRDVTDQAARRAKLLQLARIGLAVQAERSEEAIYQVVHRGLGEIGLISVLLVTEGAQLRIASRQAPPELVAEAESLLGRQMLGSTGAWTPNLLKIWQTGAAYTDDCVLEAMEFFGPGMQETARKIASRSGLERAIGTRIDVAGAPAAILVILGEWLREEHLPAVRLLGAQISAALENAWLYNEARRRVEDLSLINQMSRTLVTTLELEPVLEAGVRNLARIVSAPAAFLLLLDARGDALEVRAATSEHRSFIGLKLPLDPREGSLCAWVFHAGQPVLVEDTLHDPRMREYELKCIADARACLALPLVVRDRPIGVALIVELQQPRRFTPAEMERAAAIANQVAAAVENARLYEDLHKSYTELTRAHEKLVHKERMAALGELAAIVAHEVRNPLGVLFNSLGSLRKLIQPEGDAQVLLDIMSEEAERLNHIVSDLLDFARPISPALRTERLEPILDDVLAATTGTAVEGIEVVRDVASDLPAVPIDARLVRQALLNLVTNALQAMPRGGTLRLQARSETDDQGQWVRMDISDTGPGIPEELRARVFEPFFTTKATGTGLGLAVVKRIVDGHRGKIAVTSEPGQGTTFTLWFPLEPLPSTPVPPG